MPGAHSALVDAQLGELVPWMDRWCFGRLPEPAAQRAFCALLRDHLNRRLDAVDAELLAGA